MLKDARHPILDTMNIQPVDAFCCSALNFQLITGANMAGKSTYIKTIAVLTIMAQIGCPLPCSFASISIRKSILSRLSNDDDVEGQLSTFMMEMKEISYILDYAYEESLILIDELGRGTSPTEGLAISLAICEELVQKKVKISANCSLLYILSLIFNKFLNSCPDKSM